MGKIAANNYNINGDIINNNDLKNKYISCCFGEWNNLCPIYISVGATEMLLGDSLYISNKINQSNGKVLLNIEPFLPHIFPVCVNVFPEAKYSVVRATDWILNNFYLNHSKL